MDQSTMSFCSSDNYAYDCADEDEEEDEELNEINETFNISDESFQQDESILTISYQECKIGIAYYRVGSFKIDLLHEMYEFDDFVVIRKVLRKLMPSSVIVSSKCGNKLFALLKNYSQQKSNDDRLEDSSRSHGLVESAINDSNVDGIRSDSNRIDSNDSFHLNETTLGTSFIHFKLHVISSRMFHYDQCKSRVLSVNFPQLSNISDKTERFIYLTSYIDFFEINTIKSLGVLLQFIEKQLVIQHYANNRFRLNTLSELAYFDLDDFVAIDQFTFEALDIFQNEWHPSIPRKGLAKKEGFTLFGVFNSCASKVGSNHLRRIFLQPLTDSTILEERFTIIDFFTKPSNSNLKHTLYHFLKNIKDVHPIINRLRSMNSTVSDFRLLRQTSLSTISIRNILANNPIMNCDSNGFKLKIFKVILQQFTTALDEIYECLEKTIDLKKSKEDGKVVLKNGIDELLDQLKFHFNKLPEILRNSIAKEDFVTDLIKNHNVNITVIYLPQLGFLLKLLLVETQKINDIDQYGLDLIFCANDSAYYKNVLTIHFDKLFGDILSEINDRTQQVLYVIKDYLLERVPVLSMAITCCAFLDAMLAMAQTAIDYDFVQPKLTCYGNIVIHQGRHPLYELITKTFVPNDYYSDDRLCKTLLVLGLNGCGKTVYLKQVCLIVYLAHIGSFVPAKHAEITILDKIFTRIRTPESISTQLSSFKHDLNQMISATRYARRRSLVVIDLFGKSTLHSDGLALLEAIINHFIHKDQRPHLLISTHFNLISKLTPTCRDAVQIYSFANHLDNSERDFQLKPFENNQNIEQPFFVHIAPELAEINDLIKVNIDLMVPKLELKQKLYLELAQLILNNHPLDRINQFLSEIKTIKNKE